MKNILVIGATGTVGREVVNQLIDTRVNVRALTRSPESARLPQVVEVFRGDLTDPATLVQPLKDVDAVFLVWTAPATAAESALKEITGAVPRVVYLSAPHQTDHPFFQQVNPVADVHRENERLLAKSAQQWTILRPGMFATNSLFWWAPTIRAGNVVRWPYAEAPTSPIHERDIAAVAVRTLCEDGHAGNDYVLTGPQSLTQAEQVHIISEVIGRPLRYEELTPDEARQELLPVMPLFVIDMLLNAFAAALGQPAYLTSKVAELTGAPARTFREWASDHAAEFKQ
jgi:uncharacterized protein YbjT (DUF2867 family)